VFVVTIHPTIGKDVNASPLPQVVDKHRKRDKRDKVLEFHKGEFCLVSLKTKTVIPNSNCKLDIHKILHLFLESFYLLFEPNFKIYIPLKTMEKYVLPQDLAHHFETSLKTVYNYLKKGRSEIEVVKRD
jgi:hypothetical protein